MTIIFGILLKYCPIIFYAFVLLVTTTLDIGEVLPLWSMCMQQLVLLIVHASSCDAEKIQLLSLGNVSIHMLQAYHVTHLQSLEWEKYSWSISQIIIICNNLWQVEQVLVILFAAV